MGSDPRKRQKKLERRAAKRKEKKHIQVREQTAPLAERLAAAVRFPVLHCTIGDSLQEEGLGWVLLSREIPGGKVAAASFLVDRYCLGVKNVFGEVLSRPEYDAKYVRKMKVDMPSHSVPPAEARKLLEEAVAYAHGLGLPPHADYTRMLTLFGSIDPAESNAHFEFGKDGKPLFVAGPNDTPERCRAILGILTESCGPGGFHYIMPVAGSTPIRVLPGSRGGDLDFLETDEEDLDEEE